MTRKPKATSQAAKTSSATSQTSDKENPATRRSAASPSAPGVEEGGEFSSPACFAHEVDPAYMMAPSKPAPSAEPEKSKTEPAEPQSAAVPDQKAPAAKAPPPKPTRTSDQGPKPSWADRHRHAPRDQGRGRMRVGRPHGRGQGG